MERLKYNTEEKSNESASFFCIKAVFNPLFTNTVAILINARSSAHKP